MKKFLTALLVLILTATTISSSVVADVAISEDVNSKITSTIKYILDTNNVSSEQELLDEVYAKNTDVCGEWIVIALRQYLAGSIDFSTYRKSLEETVTTNSSQVATTRERQSLALQATGSTLDYMNKTLSDSPDQIGIMSYVFGLHLASNGATSDVWTKEALIDSILALEIEGGGFSVVGNTPDVDVTAMTLQALALYKDEARVAAVIDRGLAILQNMQLDDGNFGTEETKSAESNAQVLVCLSSLGIDAAKDERFIKNSHTIFDAIATYEIGDGSYAHINGGDSDSMATEQVLYSLVAYTLLESSETLYHFTSDINTKKHDSAVAEVSTSSSALNTKTIILCVIAALVLITCIVLFVLGKRSIKSYLAVIIIGGAIFSIFFFMNFSSADNYYGKTEEVTGAKITTTISINCDTIKESGKEHVPDDGVILPETTITVTDGASAYEQLVSACKTYSIQLETEGTAKDAYVAGLAYIYEYDFGDLSGWMFKVNGTFADVGCGSIKLKEGDKVEWVYTTDLGKDVGDDSFTNK